MAIFDARLWSTLPLIPIVFISSYFLFMATLIFMHAVIYSPPMAAFLFDTGDFPVSYQLYLWALRSFERGAPVFLDIVKVFLDFAFFYVRPFLLRFAAWVFYFLR